MAVVTDALYHIAICKVGNLGSHAGAFARIPAANTVNGDQTSDWTDAIAANAHTDLGGALVLVVSNHDEAPMFVAQGGDDNKYQTIAAGMTREFEYDPKLAFRVRK